MSSDTLQAADVARFLASNPGFLAEHPDVFRSLQVPHPRQANVIPLGERQNLVLRDRVRDLELALAALRHQAARNEHISAQLQAWLTDLLAEHDSARLAQRFVDGLVREFNLQGVALLAWQPVLNVHAVPEGQATSAATAVLDDDAIQALRQYTTALSRPACLPADNTDLALAPLLATARSDAAAATGSLAVAPVRALHDGSHCDAEGTDAVGVLVLLDASRDRYTPDMDTLFLERIAHLAGAVLTRLAATASQA